MQMDFVSQRDGFCPWSPALTLKFVVSINTVGFEMLDFRHMPECFCGVSVIPTDVSCWMSYTGSIVPNGLYQELC